MAGPHLTGDHYGDSAAGSYSEEQSEPLYGSAYGPDSGFPEPGTYGHHPQHPQEFAQHGQHGMHHGVHQGARHDGHYGMSGGSEHDAYQEHDEIGEDEPLVRPYAMTGGRTRPRYQLAIEALVSTTDQAAQTPGLLPEHQRIVSLCGQVKSVAEISALLSIPLGVARILVADLAEAGLVAIHQPGSTEAGQPDLTLLERVLSGLRKL
jgi:hypothetical protein